MARSKSAFKDFIDGHRPSELTLPLVHTIPAIKFVDLCDGDFLEPTSCEHFKSDLLYLFYGRPAYRTERAEFADLSFNWPIVLIINPVAVDDIAAVFPFDTGAFFKGLYHRYISKYQKVDEFALPGDIKNAEKIVGTFYLSNAEYMKGRSTKNVELPPLSFAAEGIQKLAREPAFTERLGADHLTRDERSSSIEVQSRKRIDISSAVLKIILPQDFLRYQIVIEALDRWRISTEKIEYYETFQGADTQGITSQIYLLVMRAYRAWGLVK